jgi:hypothetical protein
MKRTEKLPFAGFISLMALVLLVAGCASIPPESAQLSQTLGQRIEALELAHEAAIRAFFDAKRAAARKFMEDEWTPQFANNYLSSPKVSKMLAQTCGRQSHADCLHAILIISKQAELQIQTRYREILDPLAETETAVEAAVHAGYADAERRNEALTTLLTSAAKVQTERQAVEAKFGIDESRISGVLATVNDQVADLTSDAKSLDTKLTSFTKAMTNVRESLHGTVNGEP